MYERILFKKYDEFSKYHYDQQSKSKILYIICRIRCNYPSLSERIRNYPNKFLIRTYPNLNAMTLIPDDQTGILLIGLLLLELLLRHIYVLRNSIWLLEIIKKEKMKVTVYEPGYYAVNCKLFEAG